jgi:hypothetical protein
MLEKDNQLQSITGGYYWFPVPDAPSLTWTVLTCHELGCDADVGHPRRWPLVLDRLAQAWQRDARLLKKRLRDHYTGLPRGRVTRPHKVYFVLHGGDSTIGTWEAAVIRSFNLQGHRVKPIFDEHERQLPYDVRAVAKLFAPFGMLAQLDTSSAET